MGNAKTLIPLYLLTYVGIVLIRRYALDSTWSGAFFGWFPLLFLAVAATSVLLSPLLHRTRDRT